MKKIFTTISILLTMIFAAKASDTITLNLNTPLNPAVFTFDANGVWTETYNDHDYPFISFDNFELSHLISGNSYYGTSWEGFTVSKNADNTALLKTDGVNFELMSFKDYQNWGNMAKGGIVTDAEGRAVKDGTTGRVLTSVNIPYLIAYWSWYCDEVLEDYSLQTIFYDKSQPLGFYINASPFAYFSNIYGDGWARALNHEGDYFKIIIHGLDEEFEDNGESVEYTLTSFEGGILKLNGRDWEWVDLSSLGECYGLYFTMKSTDNSYNMMNTPSYFCMDKLSIKAGTSKNAENIISDAIKVYPNPTNDYLKIQGFEDLNIKSAEIYDVTGKNHQVVDVSNFQKIDVSQLPSGTYFLKIGDIVKKFVKK
jgi:hypothetical protein